MFEPLKPEGAFKEALRAMLNTPPGACNKMEAKGPRGIEAKKPGPKKRNDAGPEESAR